MAMAFEVLGISPMGSSMVPAEDGKKGKVAEECGRLVMEVLAAGPAARAASSPSDSLENAIAAGAMSGGSTNLVLHLLAVAHEAGVPLELEDFDRIAWQHAAAVRPEAGRPLRGHRPLPRRRRAARDQAAEGARRCSTRTR